MAGNEELWEFRAVDAGFVATTQILSAEIANLKKESAELTKNFVEGNKKNKLSIEELTAKIAENTEKVRAGSDILRERLKIITDTKQKYVEDLSAYSAKWRQKLDLDREEAAAKVANAERDAIETKRREDEKSQIFEQKFRERMAKHKLEQDEIHQVNDKLIADDARLAAIQVAADTGPVASKKAQALAALKTELFQLNRQQEELQRTAADAMHALTGGSKVAGVALENLEEELLRIRKRIHDVNRELEAKDGFRGARMMFTEGARGAQDFLTVLSMPGMGLTDAFRAASNNIEVMAMSIKGLNTNYIVMATMLPSLIQGTTALHSWLTKEAKEILEVEKAEEKSNAAFAKSINTLKDYNDHIRRMNELQGESKSKIEGVIEVEGKLIDMRRPEMLEKTEKALAGTDSTMQKIKDRLAAANKAVVEAHGNPIASLWAAWEMSSAMADARDRLPALDKDKRRLGDKLKELNKERDAEIAKSTIENELRPQDDVINKRAALEAAAIAEGFASPEGAMTRIIRGTGIVPEGEAQGKYLRNRAKQFLDAQNEKLAASRFSSDNEERGMTEEQRRAKDKAFMRSVIDKELEDENLRVEQAKRKKDDFEKIVNANRLRDGSERAFMGGKSTVKTRRELEQEIRDRERERDDERKRLEKSMGFDPAVAMGMLKGINRLVELFERDGAPEVAAAPARARVFGMPMRNPDIASFEPGMA